MSSPIQKQETTAPELRPENARTTLSADKHHIQLERVQYFTLCGTLFLAGWNDGSLGPLLPSLKADFHLGFTVASVVFVFGIAGAMTGALCNVVLTERFGFGRVLILGAAAQVIGYALMIPGPRLPFPVYVLGFSLNGFGSAVQDAQANGYVASMMRSPATKMGFIHAFYGLGALCSPLIATQFSKMTKRRWSFHYLTCLGLAILNFVLVVVVFKGRRQQDCLNRIGQPTPIEDPMLNKKNRTALSRIMRSKNVYLLASFLFVYVGVEVAMGGFVVSYLQIERNGGADSGYASAGFFGGLTVGRVILLPVNKWLGERTALFVYAVITLGLQIVSWLVKSLYGTAIAISLEGLFLGPFYPIVMNHAGRILPPSILTGGIGYIAGISWVGGAVFPFITGALSGRFGIWSSQPLLVAMIAFMFLVWIIVPSGKKKQKVIMESNVSDEEKTEQ